MLHDSFDTSTYTEGAGRLVEALEAADLDVDYLPAHLGARPLPRHGRRPGRLRPGYGPLWGNLLQWLTGQQ